MCHLYGMTMSVEKKAVDRTCQNPYILDLEVKGLCRIGIMNIRYIRSHIVIDPMLQIRCNNVKVNRNYGLNTKTCLIKKIKPYKFDLEVKGQHRIVIKNVRDTSSYGDRHMCKIS